MWHQTANPVLTLDDAAAWIEEMGLCLFLPRHAQLPAPAPSLVEACAGEARAVFAAAAVDSAMEMVVRLAAEGRAVPLNLMGNFSELPDFLASPEALRWIAAVRGDRNWKAAPAGRTSPIVARTWEALDSGEKTVTEIQDLLGRELTEGAILRALIELWTTLRAFPRYESGQPTRWALAKDRFPRELGAGASSAQTTALSALISLYLGSVIAATEEETEIFLSPLTARSRVREVLHGMMATRQLGTMALGVNTLLFVEGSLPEMAPEPEVEEAATVRPAPQAIDAPRKGGHEPQRERPAPGVRREARGEARPRRPDFGGGRKPTFRPGQRRDSGAAGGKPWEKRRPGGFAAPAGQGRPERGPRREGGPERGEKREGGWKAKKPWQPGDRPAAKRPFAREGRPAGKRPFARESGPAGETGKRFEGRPSGERGKRFEGRPPGDKRERFEGRPSSAKPWEKRGPREERKFGERPSGPKQFGAKKFGQGKFGPKKSAAGPGFAGPKQFGAKKFGQGKFGPKKSGPGRDFTGPKQFGAKKFGQSKFGPKKSGPRPGFAGPKESGTEDRRPSGPRPPFRAGEAASSREAPGKPFRPGAPKWQNRPDRKTGRFGKPQGKGFRKPGAPAGRKPRKPGEGKEEA